VNECDSNPCQNGGVCTDSSSNPSISVHAYSCACVNGFANGVCNSVLSQYQSACTVAESTASPSLSGNCDVDIDECSSDPCQNAAVCDDSLSATAISFDAFRCTCRPGYASGLCAFDFIPEYSAACQVMESTALMTGQGRCQVDMNECDSNPCQNGAACTESTSVPSVSVWQYRCTCVEGFASGTCGYAFLEQYTSRCTLLESGSAELAAGNCEEDVDECVSNPCQNGAACTDSGSVNSTLPASVYLCTCLPGFGNENCDLDIDECDSAPCHNSGVCAESRTSGGSVSIGSFRCSCAPGFASGVCEYDFISEYATECNMTESNEGLTRADGTPLQGRCELDVAECDSSPCQNGGVCGYDSTLDDEMCIVPDSYSCDCPPGWFGKDCEIDNPACSMDPCKNGANCTASGDSFECTCAPGWTGATCASNINDCDGQCVNSGVCIDGVNSYSCACAAGYEGMNCADDVNECSSGPCQNVAPCDEGIDSYSCTCAAGFNGDNCDVDINECSSQPCRNGADCIDSEAIGLGVPVGAYRCACMAGYSSGLCAYVNGVPDYDAWCSISSSVQPGLAGGAGQCTVDVNECVSNPCQNDAECSESTTDPSIPAAEFYCRCQPGYSSGNCAIDVDECASAPCVNGAACSDSTDTDSGVVVSAYACACIDGFASGLCAYADVIAEYEVQCSISGSTQIGLAAGAGNCAVDVNECASSPCENDQPCFESGSAGVTMPISEWRCECGSFCVSPEQENKPEESCVAGMDGPLQASSGEMCETVTSACYTADAAQCDPVNSVCFSLGPGSFECVCDDGWTPAAGAPEGTVATGGCIDIDECSSNPCQHGGLCTESACGPGTNCFAGTGSSTAPPLGTYRCNCAAGFANGVCASGWDDKAPVITNWYSPVCSRSTGGNCDVDIQECMSAPCVNGAECVESSSASVVSADTYRCTCATGFANGACDYNRDSEVNSADTYIAQYTDLCNVMESDDGDTGGTCDMDVDECASNPCQNGAECVESSSPTADVSLHAYMCKCTQGFANGLCDYTFLSEYATECTVAESNDRVMGGNCDIDVDECASSPCHNGAACTESSVDPAISLWTYRCTCVAGYTSGKCEYDFISEYTSECAATESSEASASDWSGNCDVDVDECASSPCTNDAVCTESAVEPAVSPHAYQCTCVPGFANGVCEYAFISEYTDECSVAESSASSVLSGNCDIDVNECDSSPCANGAICTDSTSEQSVSSHAYQCTCTAGFANGQCDYESIVPQYAMQCAVFESTATSDWSGNCDIDVDECDSSPCQNEAVCRESSGYPSISTHSYQCSCVPGFANGLCEYDYLHGSDIDAVNEVGGMYTDHCTVEESCRVGEESCAAFTGNCDVDVDECISGPCHHGGTCSELNNTVITTQQRIRGAKLYSCECSEPWQNGADCEVKGTFSWACERGQMPVDTGVTDWNDEPPRVTQCRECGLGRYSPDGVRCIRCTDVAAPVEATCSRLTNLRGVIIKEEWPCTRQYTCIKCPPGLVPNTPENATHCIDAMGLDDGGSTESLGDSVASEITIAHLEISVIGELTEQVTHDIIAAIAATMGVDPDTMRGTDGGPPQFLCLSACCDSVATEEHIECECNTFDAEVTDDPFNTCSNGAGRRLSLSLRMVQATVVATNLSITAYGNSTRRLQAATSARDFALEFVIEGDPLAQLKIGALLENIDVAMADVPGVEIDQMGSENKCPEGKIRAGANVLCQECPYPGFTPDAIQCQQCPEGQVPTDKGDDCRCADGWYNSSTGYVTCHDESVSVDELLDVPAFLFAAQQTAVGVDPGPYGTQCSRCPGDCVTCDDGIIRVIPGYALNSRQAAKESPLDATPGMRHVFKCVGNHSETVNPIQCLGETELQWDGVDPEEFMDPDARVRMFGKLLRRMLPPTAHHMRVSED
jgi:hypothetical protein